MTATHRYRHLTAGHLCALARESCRSSLRVLLVTAAVHATTSFRGGFRAILLFLGLHTTHRTRAAMAALSLACVLGATVEAAKGKQSQPELFKEPYAQRQVALRDCAYEHADAHADTGAKAGDIADAALHECAKQSDELGAAANQWMASMATNRKARTHLLALTQEHRSITRDNIRRAVINRVLTRRNQAATQGKTPGRLALRRYYDCGSKYVAIHIDDPLPAIQIAEDAVTACEGDYQAFQAASQAPFVSKDEDARQKIEALGMEMRAKLRRILLDSLVADRQTVGWKFDSIPPSIKTPLRNQSRDAVPSNGSGHNAEQSPSLIVRSSVPPIPGHFLWRDSLI
jgi:hypothetical protein